MPTLIHFILLIVYTAIVFGVGWYACRDNHDAKRRAKNRDLGPVSLRALKESRRA